MKDGTISPCAFPTPVFRDEIMAGCVNGMSLRDYFAAAALQGALAFPSEEQGEPEAMAMWSYDMADAMLKAREE